MAKRIRKATRRAKGFGGLVKRGSIWYARWTAEGVAHLESTGIRVDEEGAKERALKILAEKTEIGRLEKRERRLAIVQAELSSTREQLKTLMAKAEKKLVCKDMWKAFVDSPRRRDITDDQMKRYGGWVSAFVEWIGAERSMRKVTWGDAEEYAKKLGREVSPNTYNKHINALRMVWKVLGRAAGLEINPWEEIQTKRLDTHKRRRLTDEEMELLVEKSEGELRKLIVVGAYTGLRLNDACLLRWEDFHDGNVDVKTSKTGAKVSIPSHPKLVAILGEENFDQDGNARLSGYVLPEIAKSVLGASGTSNISASVTALMERCGIKTQVDVGVGQKRPDAGFHSLRHTFVSKAIEAGVPPAIVQVLVGHSNAQTTARYTHISDEAILSAFRNMK